MSLRYSADFRRSRLVFLFFSSDHRRHRVCTTFYRLHSHSHVLVSTRFTVNPVVTGLSPCFRQKLFRAIFFGTVRLFQFFSALCDFFFDIFLSPKGPPSSFFDILQQTEVSKSRKGPQLKKNKKNCAFLSLRYSADFRRSRLVQTS